MEHLATTLIHADDRDNRVPDVAPPINVSTTYRYDKDDLVPWRDRESLEFMDKRPIYSRLAHPNSTRLESLFSQILGGHAVVYNSGLAAFFAALIHYNPKRLFIDQSYHGCRAIAHILTRTTGMQQCSLDDVPQMAQPGDVVHLESPVNPLGTVPRDMSLLAEQAHERGAVLIVDSTFAPPPLQDPWRFGCDMVMHSATKYFGGHSDLLSGVLVTRDQQTAGALRDDRIYLGTNVANLEAYLLLRSLRTFELRIQRQSTNCTAVVAYLNDHRGDWPLVLDKLYHSSLQTGEPWVAEQLEGGHPPVFALTLRSIDQCKRFPQLLHYFQHATSLGGVESLVEWRAMTDPHIDQTLVRVSVGCENAEDLIADLTTALNALQSDP
ncbi:putative cystathionine beta-lyase KNAG_0C04990 [Huiozyma naganishii CBS 8797]|uniref:Cystathionine beta-lyase n=1 Tax=Huiozyma naganishii (strain ATCC MYA-139 / BCRC 22969 / CBS 8797 / KCTC 17520 / NBRC 10181 / NCYC 3082 / Yp74L-3) TaxID=1071383 RepID=J7R434_HUIN7|nr:hypothetical protein KNAG_0C04990 [Kazachstania naganishii CBS 8797]CCK69600.1 hypothetical protein KNAG_0C04990 [Kazachstania naganishii CBS 8797]